MEEFICFGVMILLFTAFGISVASLIASAVEKIIFRKK